MADESSKIIEGQAGMKLSGVTARGVGRVQVRFAIFHLGAAAQFSRRVGEIEREHAGHEYGPFCEEIIWQASACVICCVASLEAYANEFFIDRDQHFPDLRKEVADRFWELFEQKPLLEKYELALLLRNKPGLDRGTRPSQDINALIKLRDVLIHFKPEWEDEQDVHDRVSRLLNGRFQKSPFPTGEATIFPRLWASHGCTSWAVSSCLEFVRAFEERAEIPSRLPVSISQLKP